MLSKTRWPCKQRLWNRSIILCFIISRSISFLAPMSPTCKCLFENAPWISVCRFPYFKQKKFRILHRYFAGKHYTFMNIYFFIFNNVMNISITYLLLYNKFTYWCILSMREIRYSMFPAGLSPLTSVRFVW